MTGYLNHTFNENDPELISVIDELPLWSAPFGLKLLETVDIKANMNVLDIGCGLGFPLIEIAQRMGKTCSVVGMDPWLNALKRIKLKINVYSLTNVDVIRAQAESMPFESQSFDLLLSNNGITNVQDMLISLDECFRVSKSGAQFVLTYNLEESMIEFYRIYEAVLREEKMTEHIYRLKEHIYDKRKPLSQMRELLSSKGFTIVHIEKSEFCLEFVDPLSMFNHSLIKYWFLPSWKGIIPQEKSEYIFTKIEQELATVATEKGKITLTIPFATINMVKQ